MLGLPGAGLAQYGPPSPIGGGLAGSSEIASFGDGSAEPPATRVQTAGGGAYEYVVVGPQGDSDAVRRAIEAAGGTVLRTGTLSALGEVTTVSTFPSQASYDRARALIAQQAPRSSLAPQHLYRFAAGAGPRLYAPGLIGDPAPGRCRLTRPVTIGMIDGPVNPDHPALRRADVTYETLVPGTLVPGGDHGTAVAALLVGEDDSGALAGFARGARLYAVSVFSERDDLEGASVERVAQGIDRLVAHGIRLINLSLAGPENAALGRAISAAAARGAVMIAASGNDRRPHVAWPAAAPEVIAVTAVDAAFRRYRVALGSRGAPTPVFDLLDARGFALGLAPQAAIAVLAAWAAVGLPWQGLALALAGLGAAVTGWLFKYALITRAAFNQGYAIERMPARGANDSAPGIRPGWTRA